MSRDVKFRTYEATFGDGYSQRTPMGLNSKQPSISLVWSKLDVFDADTIEQFLEDNGAVTPFYYSHPKTGRRELYICRTYKREDETGLLDKISATFDIVYDLDID